MTIDFSPVQRRETTLHAFAQQFGPADLIAATRESADTWLELIRALTPAQLTFMPHDPTAHDPRAPEAERHIGWPIAKIVTHICAAGEIDALLSSLAARGIACELDERLRVETDWHTITTPEQACALYENSLHIRLAYLSAWGKHPRFDVEIATPERMRAFVGGFNAKTAALGAVWHEVNHLGQARKIVESAK